MNNMPIIIYRQMNECRYHSAAAVVNGKIFCSGGFGDEHAPLKSVECYDPSSDVWTLICNVPQEICAHGAIEMNGNFIVMGGYNLQNKYLKNVWALDITDKDAAWIEKQSMPMPCKEFSIARIDNEIFICGGAGTDYTVEIFEGEVWKNGPKMPARRYYTPAVVISMEFARFLN